MGNEDDKKLVEPVVEEPKVQEVVEAEVGQGEKSEVKETAKLPVVKFPKLGSYDA